MSAIRPAALAASKLPILRQDKSGHGANDEEDEDSEINATDPPGKSRKPRRLTKIACQGCQRSKAKCDGSHPSCGRCIARKKECIYESEDRRNKDSLRKSLDDALQENSELTDLLSLMKISNESGMLSLWRQLQAGATAREIFSNTGRDPNGKSLLDEDPDPMLEESMQIEKDALVLSRSMSMSGVSSPRDESFLRQLSGDTHASSLASLMANAFHSGQALDFFGTYSQLGLNQPQLRIQGNMDPALNVSIPIYLMQPKHIPDKGPFSQTILSFRNHVRQALSEGYSENKYLGIPGEVCANSFMDGSLPSSTDLDCDEWACKVAMSFDRLGPIQVLGSIVLLTNFMKWCVRPSEPRYLAIGKILQPSLAQLIIPHRADIDVCVPAVIRDALIERWRDYLPAITASLRLSWKGQVSDAVFFDNVRQRWLVNEEFQDFVKHPDNWTFRRDFLELFPEGEGHIQIRPDD